MGERVARKRSCVTMNERDYRACITRQMGAPAGNEHVLTRDSRAVWGALTGGYATEFARFDGSECNGIRGAVASVGWLVMTLELLGSGTAC